MHAPAAGAEAASLAKTPWIVGVVDGFSKLLMRISAVAVVLLAGHVFVDVIYRRLTGDRLPGTLEYTSYWWLPAMVFLAMAGAQLYEEHLRVTIAVDRAQPAVKRFMDIVAFAVGSVAVAILVYYAYLGAADSMAKNELTHGVTNIAIWPFKWLTVVGLVALLLQTLVSIVRLLGFAPPVEPDDAAEIIEGEL